MGRVVARLSSRLRVRAERMLGLLATGTPPHPSLVLEAGLGGWSVVGAPSVSPGRLARGAAVSRSVSSPRYHWHCRTFHSLGCLGGFRGTPSFRGAPGASCLGAFLGRSSWGFCGLVARPSCRRHLGVGARLPAVSRGVGRCSPSVGGAWRLKALWGASPWAGRGALGTCQSRAPCALQPPSPMRGGRSVCSRGRWGVVDWLPSAVGSRCSAASWGAGSASRCSWASCAWGSPRLSMGLP